MTWKKFSKKLDNIQFSFYCLLQIRIYEQLAMANKILLVLLLANVETIEILDLECVLDHVTGVQIENKNALINQIAKGHAWASLICPFQSASLNS
jgi:predicted nucleotidyltransferase